MLGTVYWTVLVVVACIVTGTPEVVALEALMVPAAPGSPDLRSLSIKPPPLSTALGSGLWRLRVGQRTSHIGVGMISFWCSSVTYMDFWKIQS